MVAEVLKIGAFLCGCDKTISEISDSLCDYISTLPQVEHIAKVEDFDSEEGREAIKSAIRDKGLNRIVVAGYTPKVAEQVLSNILVEAGLNPYLFSSANIVEQCSRVHRDKEKVLDKAKRLIYAAYRRACLLEPLDNQEIEVIKRVLILGGGIAGIQASLELSDLGYEVILVEREAELGGKMVKLSSLYQLDTKPSELLESKIKEINRRDNIRVLTDSELLSLKGYVGNFKAEIVRNEALFEVGAVIIATGFDTYEDGYSAKLSEVIMTQFQFEEKLKEGLKVKEGSCICFLLDSIDYGTKLSSMTALKNALFLREQFNCEIFLLYRNMKVAEEGLERLYQRVRDSGVMLCKYEEEPRLLGETSIRFKDLLVGEELRLDYDLLILAERIGPSRDFEELGDILDIAYDEEGFYPEDDIYLLPYNSSRRGVFLVGGCRGSRSVTQTMFEVSSTVSEIHSLLSEGKTVITMDKAIVDSEKCTFCLTCYRTCPHSAIVLDYEEQAARIIEAACQACGICAGECPAKAIQLRHYTDDQVIAQLEIAIT